jgi:ferredoxin--NADP+ reductase
MSSPAALRIAIVGTGPSGFYAAEHLLKHASDAGIDLFDRLPTPFGLVRGGVAPDHQKIKSVTRVFERIAADPRVRFFGNVMIGRDLTRADLRRHYHAIIYACGAASDRVLGIPGEALPGSHPATDFVGWYNGHPDYCGLSFDLSRPSVAVVGMGNVAVDVVRILARTPEELARTDIADYALDALRASAVRDIYMIGRRGPVQAAFTHPELKELGEMPGAGIHVRPEDLELDPGSAAQLAAGEEKTAEKNLATLQEFAARPAAGKPRTIHLRFLESPVRLEGEARVEHIILGRNRLVQAAGGDLRAEPTGATARLAADAVFRSVGYLGTGLPDVPFDPTRGIIPRDRGRVLDGPAAARGEYAAGWIKRGPSGVIGTNKPDAVETATLLLEDAAAGVLAAAEPAPEAVDELLARRGVRVVRWPGWQRLDQLEQARAKAAGRPRIKFTRIDEMLDLSGA